MDSSSFFLTTVVAATIGLFTLFKKLRLHQEDDKETSSPPPSPSSLSSPPSPLNRIWTHHVFPSLRGEDVRRDFLSHIQMEFQRMGITPFIDNEIKRGESIGPELIRAIQGSKIAIILLSRNYASSSWCLDELAEIMKCREELGQMVMVVFYKVDPSDVKKLTGEFGKIFKKTCAGKTKQDIGRWRQALAKVATIAGYHSNSWDNEAAMIKQISTDISNKLNNSVSSSDLDELVGMRAHLEEMEPLLCLESDEVRMIGLWGPSGIGKTTIARVVYNNLSNSFQLSVFMESIEAKYTRPCSDDYSAKLHLQQQFMSQITNQDDMKISHLGVVQDRLKDKKVLVVLDGVDQSMQLDAMAKETWWFGPGSRIIITSQDRKLFRRHGINHIYQVDFPPPKEALQILCTYAFGQKFPKDGFEKLAWEVTELAGKLPLGLRVMGSYFRGMSKREWAKELPRLRTSLHADIQSILKFSYDALDDENKYIFLHIACFFNYQVIEKVEEHLAEMFLDVRHGFNVLAEKSLISIDDRSRITMHNLLVQLGRDIVRKQFVREPGQRLYLVDAKEICEILTDDVQASRSVMGIDFNFSTIRVKENFQISERAFQGMTNLQFLRLWGGMEDTLHLPCGLEYMPRKLRLLKWKYFPMTCLPPVFNSEFLVEVDLCFSKLEKLWEGIKPLPNLKWMDMTFSKNLEELPDLSTATKLMELNLECCSSLVKLPSTIGCTKNLQKLDLSYCSSLISLPSTIGYTKNLQELNLSHCSSLISLPSTIGYTKNLQKLDLSHCSSLISLPSTIGYTKNLQELNLSHCSSLISLPSTIGYTKNLQKLDLSHCSSLISLPSTIGYTKNLQELNLSHCSSLISLPSTIGYTKNLQKLDLSHCSSLVSLPSTIGYTKNLQELNLSHCSSLISLPSTIGYTKNLQELSLSHCSSLISLPSTIGYTKNLQELNLSHCSSLISLPSTIGYTKNLQELSLSHYSSLISLPSTIGYTKYLQELNLSHCSSLISLPSTIGYTKNLHKLDLNHCSSLVELTSSVGNLSNLKELDLSHCSSLVEFSSLIGNATNLEFLDLRHCSSLVKLPFSIGNLQKLQTLSLEGCSKLEFLPNNINLEYLYALNLKDCLLLKTFPEISTNLRVLDLTGTAIEEVPSSIESWSSRLTKLWMSYSERLKEYPHAFDIITHLHVSDKEIQELPPWIQKFSRLYTLKLYRCKKLVSFPQISDSIVLITADDCESLEELPSCINSRLSRLLLTGCRKLVSLPQIPDSLSRICAEDCESLERLDCSFQNLDIDRLKFDKCFKLNQEARDLIIQTPTSEYAVLPGREVPACFTHRSVTGGSLIIELNEKPLPTSMRFKACVLLVNEGVHQTWSPVCVTCCKSNMSLSLVLTEHLYIFEVEMDVTSSELVFEFKVNQRAWKIEQCGVLQFSEVPLMNHKSDTPRPRPILKQLLYAL